MRAKGDKFHLLLHSADLLDEQLRNHLAPMGIKPRQARIIGALARMGSASQVELAREFNVTAASMSTMTSRLISAGYILRETDPVEARANVLKLTDLGRSLLDDVHDAWREMDRVIEKAIGRSKAKDLADLTGELRDALGGHVRGTSSSTSKSRNQGSVKAKR